MPTQIITVQNKCVSSCVSPNTGKTHTEASLRRVWKECVSQSLSQRITDTAVASPLLPSWRQFASPFNGAVIQDLSMYLILPCCRGGDLPLSISRFFHHYVVQRCEKEKESKAWWIFDHKMRNLRGGGGLRWMYFMILTFGHNGAGLQSNPGGWLQGNRFALSQTCQTCGPR